jgi:Helix-turn-helix domain
VRELARLMPDRQIARLLNRCGASRPATVMDGRKSAGGFRNHHDIVVYRGGEHAERGEITLDAAAEIIGVCKMTALRMIRRGDIKCRQVCTGAPWEIKAEDIAAFAARRRSLAPVTPHPMQQTFEFQFQ